MKKGTIIGLAAAGAGAIAFALRDKQTIPPGAEPVKDFEIKKYLGKWYEIARFRYFFERNMSDTMAEYSLRDDGLIKVVNSGYDYKAGEWDEVVGKAKFRDSTSVGALEVSFFGPFYAAYNVIALADDYKYALVAGKDTSYLWLLSREKTMPEEVRKRFLSQARELGYDTTQLIWPTHDRER